MGGSDTVRGSSSRDVDWRRAAPLGASLFHNLEIVVEIVGRDFGAAMVSMFERDLARAEELTTGAWARRGWPIRTLQALAYRFRRWF